MGKKKSPEESQKKHDKHMQTFKHLNTLRKEIIKKIDGDSHLTFKKMDYKQKSKELGAYFRSNAWYFNKDTTADDVITHFKKIHHNIDFLSKIDLD